MKALQRLLVASHWSVFVFTAYCWLAVFYRLATKSHITFGRFFDDLFFDEPQIHLLLWGGLAIFLFIDWVVTGKFTLFPWHRSLPKQED
jgi:hypothetical protein